MKNQYVGDIGDYGKYGLLRFISKRGIRIGVNWYLTKDDEHIIDGNIRGYLEDDAESIYDCEVYDLLMNPPALSDLPLKGDTVIGNDVWIGQNAVILPGVLIGDGTIIGANSVVGSDVSPYTMVIGNPAKVLRKRFDEELIDLLLKFRWWDKSVEEINGLIPILTCSDLEKTREELIKQLA